MSHSPHSWSPGRKWEILKRGKGQRKYREITFQSTHTRLTSHPSPPASTCDVCFSHPSNSFSCSASMKLSGLPSLYFLSIWTTLRARHRPCKGEDHLLSSFCKLHSSTHTATDCAEHTPQQNIHPLLMLRLQSNRNLAEKIFCEIRGLGGTILCLSRNPPMLAVPYQEQLSNLQNGTNYRTYLIELPWGCTACNI